MDNGIVYLKLTKSANNTYYYDVLVVDVLGAGVLESGSPFRAVGLLTKRTHDSELSRGLLALAMSNDEDFADDVEEWTSIGDGKYKSILDFASSAWSEIRQCVARALADDNIPKAYVSSITFRAWGSGYEYVMHWKLLEKILPYLTGRDRAIWVTAPVLSKLVGVSQGVSQDVSQGALQDVSQEVLVDEGLATAGVNVGLAGSSSVGDVVKGKNNVFLPLLLCVSGLLYVFFGK